MMLECLVFFSAAIVLLVVWAVVTRHRWVRVRALLAALGCLVLMWKPLVCLFAPWYFFDSAEEKSRYYHEVTRMWHHVPWLDIRDVYDDIRRMSPQELVDYLGEPSNTDRRDEICMWLNGAQLGTVRSLLNSGENLIGCYCVFAKPGDEDGRGNELQIKFFDLDAYY
ncbi:hypothetical protein ICN84_10810 [Akkermansia glycaniphila]|uniref:hypothetical protein n=1 Tax=Akkermansia glycaniphila TaxID=1679444 RepID=UPI001C02CBC5|nr:hypothetical protein [Akkermansia glycaniphila]MBT9450557.1 hypothetical protein [Akkermansia glycaniphila]